MAKTIGGLILDLGVGEYWVPFATGFCYIGPFICLAFLTRAIPDPSQEEREKMAERRPMTQEEKVSFFSRHWMGLIAFTAPYILTTSARDFRGFFFFFFYFFFPPFPFFLFFCFLFFSFLFFSFLMKQPDRHFYC